MRIVAKKADVGIVVIDISQDSIGNASLSIQAGFLG